jgi:hypothetical protein
MYLAKIMNFSIFVAINLEMATDNVWFKDINLIRFNENNTKFDCREDQAAINLVKLVILCDNNC